MGHLLTNVNVGILFAQSDQYEQRIDRAVVPSHCSYDGWKIGNPTGSRTVLRKDWGLSEAQNRLTTDTQEQSHPPQGCCHCHCHTTSHFHQIDLSFMDLALSNIYEL